MLSIFSTPHLINTQTSRLSSSPVQPTHPPQINEQNILMANQTTNANQISKGTTTTESVSESGDDRLNQNHYPMYLPPASSLILNENRVNQTPMQQPVNQHVLSTSATPSSSSGASQDHSLSVTRNATQANSTTTGMAPGGMVNAYQNVMLPPLNNPFHYPLTTNQQSIQQQQQYQYPQQQPQQAQQVPQSPYGLNSNPSNLPPLFKLVLDSTLPITNYNSHSFLSPNSIITPPSQYTTQYNGYINSNNNNGYANSGTTISSPSYTNVGSNSNSPPDNTNGAVKKTDYQSPLSARYDSADPLQLKSRKKRYSSLTTNTSSTSSSSSTHPRKKRECPTCHLFFSNLTTHKTIHNKDSKPFTCPTCSRAFKRLNDLIRHEKCHLSRIGEWEFRCPYFDPATKTSMSPPDNADSNSDSRQSPEPCHHTGYFTRCDTYKNHLKAIHFKYPSNTLKSERMNVSGNCKECGEFFKGGVMEWLVDHIEKGECPKIIEVDSENDKFKKKDSE